MKNWYITGVAALIVIVVIIPLYAVRQLHEPDATNAVVDEAATFVGRNECIDCHTAAYESWVGSHHDDAMDVASEETVRGDFNDTEFTHVGVTSRFYRRDYIFFVEPEGPHG